MVEVLVKLLGAMKFHTLVLTKSKVSRAPVTKSLLKLSVDRARPVVRARPGRRRRPSSRRPRSFVVAEPCRRRGGRVRVGRASSWPTKSSNSASWSTSWSKTSPDCVEDDEPPDASAPRPLADEVLAGRPLEGEVEALLGHGQGRLVELLAEGLVLRAVDDSQLDGLIQVEQEPRLLGFQRLVEKGRHRVPHVIVGRCAARVGPCRLHRGDHAAFPALLGGVSSPSPWSLSTFLGGFGGLALGAVVGVPDPDHLQPGRALDVAHPRLAGLLRVRRPGEGARNRPAAWAGGRGCSGRRSAQRGSG